MSYFSHLRLSNAPSGRALSALLPKEDSPQKIAAHHHLLWSVFADHADRKRDFLWREERDGSFLVLSERPPTPNDLFQTHRTKVYEPSLSAGDRLQFSLRVNATRTKRTPKPQRVDVVMDALQKVESYERAQKRMEIAHVEGTAWLSRQALKSGFAVIDTNLEDYSTVALPRPSTSRRRQDRLSLGILELTGTLVVEEPDAFIAQVMQGFGRAKAFGCGLMLLRRSA